MGVFDTYQAELKRLSDQAKKAIQLETSSARVDALKRAFDKLSKVILKINDQKKTKLKTIKSDAVEMLLCIGYSIQSELLLRVEKNGNSKEQLRSIDNPFNPVRGLLHAYL